MNKSVPLIGVRTVHEHRIKYEHIGAITQAQQLIKLLIAMDVHNMPNEHFYTFYLNVKGMITGVELIHVGSQNRISIHPREVFKGAILNNADRIIIAHNHPSGDSTPGVEDYTVTTTLKKAGELLQIPVIDHIIIGSGLTPTSFSMHEKCVL